MVIFGEKICWKWWQVAAGCQDGQTPEEVVSPAHWDRHSDSDGWSNAGHTVDASYVNVSWRVCEYWNQKTKIFQSCGVRSLLETPRFVMRMDASNGFKGCVLISGCCISLPFCSVSCFKLGVEQKSAQCHAGCRKFGPTSRTVRSQFFSSRLVLNAKVDIHCEIYSILDENFYLYTLYSTCEKIGGDTLCQRLPWNPLIYSWFSAMEGLKHSTIEAVAIDKSLCVHHGFSLRWQLWRLRHTVASIHTTPSRLRRWVTLPWESLPFDPRNFI